MDADLEEAGDGLGKGCGGRGGGGGGNGEQGTVNVWSGSTHSTRVFRRIYRTAGTS